MRTPYRFYLGSALAAAFLVSDEWTARALEASGVRALGARPARLRVLANDVIRAFGEPPLQSVRTLARFLAGDPRIRDACSGIERRPRVRQWPVPTLVMGPARWAVPSIPTTGDLAAWLGVDTGTLLWLADSRGLERLVPHEQLRHYRYHWVAKRTGGLRLLEAPKARLKALQHRILREILDPVPPHDAAHGFRRSRSVLTHASMHAGRPVVLRVDLADFFASITKPRVRSVFRALGYPEGVAELLAALCTNRAPRMPAEVERRTLGEYPTVSGVRALRHAQMLARTPHLPQGAPTSPAIANLCAFGLDVRLSAAARAVGVAYSRYADDLVFSGDALLAGRARRFEAFVAAVAEDDGFAVNFRKTRLMRRSQQQRVAGLVVNVRARASRAEFDRAKAILHNCAAHGPVSQNIDRHEDFRAYLQGLVAWIGTGDHVRGARLRAMFDRIVWP